jgi:streptogramin lyase
MAADDLGNIYVADYMSHTIRKINQAGIVSVLAGGFLTPGLPNDPSSGTSARFNAPQGICWDMDGDLLLADYHNNVIRKISLSGNVDTVVALPEPGQPNLFRPHDVKIDEAGNMYVVDFGGGPRISKISKDGSLATLTRNCISPNMLSVDRSGFVYVSNTQNHTIEKITPSGNLTKIAGKGGYGTANGPVFEAMFDSPRAVEINPYEDLPVGLSLNAKTGEISGIPEDFGQYSLTYVVKDSCGNQLIALCDLLVENQGEATIDSFAHMSGGLLSDEFIDNFLDIIFVKSEYGNIVPSGKYPSNRSAFPNAIDTTFDSLAIGKNVNIKVYSGPSFTGQLLLDQDGPALVMNIVRQAEFPQIFEKFYSDPLLNNLFPQSRRFWSSSNMWDWADGSCIVTDISEPNN